MTLQKQNPLMYLKPLWIRSLADSLIKVCSGVIKGDDTRTILEKKPKKN